MNRKYYFNNMWWGWVTGDICCICHGIMSLIQITVLVYFSLRNGFVSGCKMVY